MTGKSRQELTMRLALRVEGSMWVAYIAQSETMEGAHLLGSIRMAIIQSSPERKAEFMRLMEESMGAVLREALGTEITFGEPHGAPEHERSGTA